MKQTPQKIALAHIAKTGSVEGLNVRTVATLERLKDIQHTAQGVILTKKGAAKLAGRLGNEGNLSRMWEGRTREAATKAGTGGRKKTKATRKTQGSNQKAHEASLKSFIGKTDAKIKKALASVLGPTGTANAVKVSRMDGTSMSWQDVDALEADGWTVIGAGTAPGRPGSMTLHGHEPMYFNPAPPLGPSGLARAFILLGSVNRDKIAELRRAGFDVSSAPKAYREARRNPEPGTGKKVYNYLKAMAKKGMAPNEEEIREKTHVENVGEALRSLLSAGLIHSPGRDLFGPVWTAGTPQRGLFDNPTKKDHAAAAVKKARAWYRKEDLVTEPEMVNWNPPKSAVHIGRIIAIEYESDKFDGVKRIYRHDVTKIREMMLSPDGTTIIVLPGFKITTRGIEG